MAAPKVVAAVVVVVVVVVVVLGVVSQVSVLFW
jgi:hypothetical protein